MKSTLERMSIPVKVHPVLKEFLIDITGSDVITPRKHDLVWSILKQNLETVPLGHIETPDTDRCIYVQLLDCHNSATWCIQQNNTLHINPLFRWHLSDRGQTRINNILRANFKSQLHSFIQGAVACNPELQQRQAMDMFFELHRLSMQKITPDMVKKSWDRSEHKLKLSNPKICTNTLFF
jgi:hypothetical protein